MKNLDDLDKLEKTIYGYTEEEILELRKILLGYNDDYEEWKSAMNVLYKGSKESISNVQKLKILKYFLKLFKNTIYEKELLDLFLELDDSVEIVIEKIDKLYFEACRYLESVLYLKSLEDKNIEVAESKNGPTIEN